MKLPFLYRLTIQIGVLRPTFGFGIIMITEGKETWIHIACIIVLSLRFIDEDYEETKPTWHWEKHYSCPKGCEEYKEEK